LELPSTGERYLILTGRQPEVWKLDAGTGVARMLTQAESLEPLGGTQFSAFLMGLPFVHWSESTYEGLVRLRSRPTHAFRMAPPFGFPVSTARFSTVRLLIDSQFNALNEVQFLDAEGARRSSFIVGELTKVDERWIMRWIDYRDEVSRDKTRFLVKRAAVGIPLPAGLFTPEALAGVIPEVPQDRVRRL
jgi:hypothetical protein